MERFADTSYWLALINTRDHLHHRALSLESSWEGALVTTEPVLLEVGNALAALHWRGLGVALLSRLRSDSGIEVLPLSPQLFSRAVELYAARPDKEWGLTDCVSFVVMRDRGIQEALSADQHFIQAGFRALLKEEA